MRRYLYQELLITAGSHKHIIFIKESLSRNQLQKVSVANAFFPEKNAKINRNFCFWKE